jgi:alkylation response protein AidB-like acyl-CoA dehydrogenase
VDFQLSPEQLLIKDSVARFAAGEHAGNDHWPTFAELGWLALGAPEAMGGFGGPVETLLVQEQFGRGLVRSPYVAQVVLAGTLLGAAARADILEPLMEGARRVAVAYEERGARFDPAIVATTVRAAGDGFIISGEKVRVLDSGTADTIVISAREDDVLSLFAVPADAAQRSPYASEDGQDSATLTLHDVRLDGAARVGDACGGLALLERGIDHAVAALCAEMLGLGTFMLEATVAYTKQRRQFGVPIGSFQSLQHRMAEMFMELELARSMAYMAAMTLQDGADDATRRRTIAAAKVQVAKSVRFIGQNAIQLHGGIGMSEEYHVGHYFKRATMLERLFGGADYFLARYQHAQPSGERAMVPAYV